MLLFNRLENVLVLDIYGTQIAVESLRGIESEDNPALDFLSYKLIITVVPNVVNAVVVVVFLVFFHNNIQYGPRSWLRLHNDLNSDMRGKNKRRKPIIVSAQSFREEIL